MLRYLLLTMVLCGICANAVAQTAVQEFTGTTPSGAWYHIQLPPGWKAGNALVMYQHGLDFKNASNPPGVGPLSKVMLGEGYAIAASSFSQRSWALFSAIDDNRELLSTFETIAGTPGEIVPFGGSLGGLISLKLAEARGFPPVRGAYALCPVAAGSRAWDAAIDLRLAYDVVCKDAGNLPTGAQPLPWALNLDQIPDNLGDLSDQVQVAKALLPLNQCTGLNLPTWLRNDAMQRRLDELMTFSHITDEDFFLTNVAYSVFVLSDLVRAPDKLANRNPFTTAGVDYSSDPAIDSGIARISADPAAAAAFRAASDFGGAVGSAKILSMHTSRDQLVIPSNQEFIRKTLPANQLTSAIVDEDTPSHCGFTAAEGLAGWEALRAWKDGAPQPDVAVLQKACSTIAASGSAPGPCRFDPGAQLASFDSIVRPRPAAPRLVVRGHSRHAIPDILLQAHKNAIAPARGAYAHP
ncbi:MAG: hypothetical protein ABI082_00115 [Dokdonella sp.]